MKKFKNMSVEEKWVIYYMCFITILFVWALLRYGDIVELSNLLRKISIAILQ